MKLIRHHQGLTVTAGSPGTISVQSITPTSTTVDAQVTVQIYETTDLSPTSADLKVYWPGEISYVSSATMTCTKTFGFNLTQHQHAVLILQTNTCY